MTKDDLIRMADLVGYDVDDDDNVYAPAQGRYGIDPRLERFAELVAAAEREACADHYLEILRIAIDSARKGEREACAYTCDINADGDWTSGALACAAAIRARGTK